MFFDKHPEVDRWYEPWLLATSPSMWTWHLWQLKINC